MLVDANNCYNSIAHPMASMVFQSFGVPTSVVESILTMIQNIKFYLRTDYGDSNGCAGGADDSSGDERKTQGICQGNGKAPAAWTVMTILMIATQQRKDYGAHFIAPITGQQGHLIGGLFNDYTNLFHLEMQENENVLQAHSKLQDGIINQGKLLIATGSALKPPKCSYYLILFRWKADGTWLYEDSTVNKNLAVGVPLADCNLTEIKHLLVTSAVKTLGSMTCPAGSIKAAIERMQSQGQEWVDRIANLSHRNTWFMVDRQFWPCLGYGICNNTATCEELDSCLQCVYWQLAPKGGVRRLAPAILRQLDRGFYGMGCPHLGMECLVAQITKLLIHYGCRSGLGLKMSVLMELLITEVGISAQPLCQPFLKYGTWVTHTWWQSLWEKVDKFAITVEIAPLPMVPPRECDKWFMQAVAEAGFMSAQEMKILNRFRCHQEVIYLSDVFDAGGRCLDRRYLDRRKQDEKWLTIIFQLEKKPKGTCASGGNACTP